MYRKNPLVNQVCSVDSSGLIWVTYVSHDCNQRTLIDWQYSAYVHACWQLTRWFDSCTALADFLFLFVSDFIINNSRLHRGLHHVLARKQQDRASTQKHTCCAAHARDRSGLSGMLWHSLHGNLYMMGVWWHINPLKGREACRAGRVPNSLKSKGYIITRPFTFKFHLRNH